MERAAVAVARRQGAWGVDGVWSYDFNKLGYACAATSHSGANPELGGDCNTDTRCGPSERCDVLRASFEHVRSAGKAAFRVLDLGAGSGGWLLQARRELEKQMRKAVVPAIHLHGVTGDALPSEIRSVAFARVSRKKRTRDDLAHFQQVGIETFPLRCGADTSEVEEQRTHFAQTVEAALAAGPGYDLIVSSWTFCHLIDPLATLELWSNALAIGGELYVNDIDFSVLFENEGSSEDDQEKRMRRAFELMDGKGREDQAFSAAFVYDEENYRTAVKVTRLSAAPIRFAPVIGYIDVSDGEVAVPRLDDGGRAVYRVSGGFDRESGEEDS